MLFLVKNGGKIKFQNAISCKNFVRLSESYYTTVVKNLSG